MKVLHAERDGAEIERLLSAGEGAETGLKEIEDTVRTMIERITQDGDRAVIEFTRRFDGVSLDPGQLEVEREEIASASQQVSSDVMSSLRVARDNIKSFHEKHLQQSWREQDDDGTILGQMILPIDRVGVYAPGGKAFYPSTVLMNVVPAKVAGCSEIVMCSPPSYNHGTVHPAILAAADLAGVTRVFRIGGTQAIAAMAYGTESVPKVDKIVGPGNIYVATAKRLVYGDVDIDAIAGPSEIVVLADAEANPAYVAADLLSQAEHDEMASAILITVSEELAGMVQEEIEEQLGHLDRVEIIRESLAKNGMILIANDTNEAIDWVNLRAPEHLELMLRDPEAILPKVRNAGAIFLGEFTPESVGDYIAGPNHVLPTGRRARFSSPLCTEDFRKRSNIIHYPRKKLEQDAQAILRLAAVEGFDAHSNAVKVRLEDAEREG